MFEFLTTAEIADSQTESPVLDLLTAFRRFADVIADGRFRRFLIPPGKYCISDAVEAKSRSISSVVLDARGAELIVTKAVPTGSKHYFRIANDEQRGQVLTVDGLSMRHNRAVGRCGNTDMMLFAGFEDYRLMNLCVHSSDNMGITVGRGDPPGFAPKSVLMTNPQVGGRVETTPHEYASIGDSGIWIVNAPRRCQIISPRVQNTGDDGILIGETTSQAAGHVFIENADISDCGGNGICLSVPHGRITGRIARTNQSGIAIQTLQGTSGGNLRIDAVIEDAGQMQAGDIGTKMIRKVHPHGIWIYQDVGNFDLDGTVIRRSFGSGIYLQTRGEGCLSGLTGRVVMDQVCQDRSGAPSGGDDQAALKRAGRAHTYVSDVSIELLVSRSRCPLVHWTMSGRSTDQRVDIRLVASDVHVDSAYYKDAPLVVLSRLGSSAGDIDGMTIRASLRRCTYAKKISAPGDVKADKLRWIDEV